MSQLYEIVPTYIDDRIRKNRNKEKSWEYGYDEKWNLIVISKDGTLGDVYYINGIYIGLPETPDKSDIRYEHNKWIPSKYPVELARLKTIFDWNKRDIAFKNRWVDYITEEFVRRDQGYWFINDGKPTYITGGHYMYLQWSKIDVGLPDFRESNRVFFLFWQACQADPRCFGMCYLKNRRSGFSFMSSSELSNTGTISKDARLGILSKTADDAKKMFTDKVVPIVRNYPFFFKPIQDGNDNPKSELAFRIPAAKITKKNMYDESDPDEITGLDTTIDWKATADNSYDGEKLLRIVHDESGKWILPLNILNNWRVTKTCLRLGSRITGKCLMGSTVNALPKGGKNFKKIYLESDPRDRNENGQTKSGLYALFIPMEHNFEGHIDEYGHAVIDEPTKPTYGPDGSLIKHGCLSRWQNEVDSLKSDPDALNEWYRQFPRTESHAFRDESKQSIFNLTKIYQQIDYNDSLIKDRVITRGRLDWKDGIQDSSVVWTPDPRGRFLTSWIPPAHLQNNVIKKGGKFFPGNEHLGAFGCDPYDISGTVDGKGSNGSLHGKTGFSMEGVPNNFFFLEYISRPPTAEIFFEDVLKACFFYGMPVLAENVKARLLYHFKNRGYRAFSMNRPDKKHDKLKGAELEIGGIPGTSQDIIQAHAAGIESYIEKYVGYDLEGTYRDSDEMGQFLFTETLEDWASFDISNRTKNDASISSGYAIMATNRHTFLHKQEPTKLTFKLPRYDNSGAVSKLIKG